MINKIILLLLLLCYNAEDYKSFISKLNLKLEEATIVTEDRYINNIWILGSSDPSNRNGKSVILQHGLLDGHLLF